MTTIITDEQLYTLYYNKVYHVNYNSRYDSGNYPNDIKKLLDFCRNSKKPISKRNKLLEIVPIYILKWVYKACKEYIKKVPTLGRNGKGKFTKVGINLKVNKYIVDYYEKIK